MAFPERYTTVYIASTSVELKDTSRYNQTQYSQTSTASHSDISATDSFTSYSSTGAHSDKGLSIVFGSTEGKRTGTAEASTGIVTFQRHNENLRTFVTSQTRQSTRDSVEPTVTVGTTTNKYTGNNTKYNFSNNKETRADFGTVGFLTGSSEMFTTSIINSLSAGLEAEGTQAQLSVFDTQSGSGSGSSGTTSLNPGGETETMSFSYRYQQIVSTAGGDLTSTFQQQTLYVYDGSSRSVTEISKQDIKGGITATYSTESRSESHHGSTQNRVIPGDPDDNTENAVLIDSSTSGETTDSYSVGPNTSNNSDSSSSFVEAYTLDTLGTSYGVKTTSSFQVDSDETTTTSTHVSDVYFLHSSLSNTDTFKIYTSTNTSDTNTDNNTGRTQVTKEQTRTVYTTETSTETNTIITAAYDYDSFLLKTLHYEGGVGIFGNTDTNSIETTYTSFNTHSTSIAENTDSVNLSTTSFSLALSSSGTADTSLTTETNLTKPTTFITESNDVLSVTTSDTTETFTDFPDPHPASATRYKSHGFLEATKESYNTAEKESLLIFSTETEGLTRSTSESSILRFQNRSQILTTTEATVHNTATQLLTYFDLSSIQTFEDTITRTEEGTTERLLNMGSNGASVTKQSANPKSTYNTLSDNNFVVTLVTWFSSVPGVRFISDDTAEISDRKNLSPPLIKYTENFLTTTVQTYPMMSGSQATATSATIYTTSTTSRESWQMPGAKQYRLQGFSFLIKDKEMTFHDTRNCSITYSDGDEIMASRATITGTYTSNVTTSSVTSNVTLTFSNTESVFRSLVENKDGAIDVEDVTTISLGYILRSTSANHFGGRRDYTNEAVMRFRSDARLTLVAFGTDGTTNSSTTEISGKLDTDEPFQSTTIDTHKRLFLSTKTEYVIGRQFESNLDSAPLATSTYGRFETNYP